jgi:hypothetical protein
MNIHHTKNKGDLGVLKAQADLCQKGYLICFPMSEHAPFDLVIYRDGSFKRVQVKARSIKNGFITVRFEHSYSDSKGVHTNKVDLKEIDLYCIYCIDNDTCYYFNPHSLANESTLSLRVEAPKNNQTKNINFADDYKEVP